jgi:hypothetical protein
MADAVVGVQRAFALNCPHEHCSQTSFLNLATHVGVKSSHLWRRRRRNRKENCADSLSGECARVCRQHHNAPPGRQPAAHTRHAHCSLCVRPIVLYMYTCTWRAAAYTLQHSAIQCWRRCLHTHMHALHLQKGNQGSNCIENSQEKANGPKLLCECDVVSRQKHKNPAH